MNSYIKTYTYENGEIQRVQIVECESFSNINFFTPQISKDAIKHIASIYQDFFISDSCKVNRIIKFWCIFAGRI